MPTIVELTVTTMITTAKLNVMKFVETSHRALVMHSILSTPIDVLFMETFLRQNFQDGQRVPLTNLGQQLQAMTNLYNVLCAEVKKYYEPNSLNLLHTFKQTQKSECNFFYY